jgi:hypothetical protein
VEFNTASGGTGSNGSANGQGLGGGLDIASGATVSIDTADVDTVDPTVVTNNTDSSHMNGSTANIDGSYIHQNC